MVSFSVVCFMLMILLAHTLRGMQKMLDICSEFALECDTKFNATKSVALRLG